MPRVALIGGHGKVALLAEPSLVESGYGVSAIIRNPAQASDVERAGATPIVADLEALDEAEIGSLLAGHDAVIWSAGAGGGDAARTYAVDRDAAIRTINATTHVGITRFLMVSYFGAGPDHGVPEDDPFFSYAEAKAAADVYLRNTDLDWTILAPSALTLGAPTGLIDVDATQSTSVDRADVAQTIVLALDEPATVHRTIRFNSGDVPIAVALNILDD